MSDNRRNASLKEVRNAIIELLAHQPMQSGDLKKALEKKGLKYSRDRLNDLLNGMIESVDIERKILDNNPYPVYSVVKKSKVIAEFNGIQFARNFQYAMMHKKHIQNLINEFQSTTKNTKLEALLKYFGFLVLAPILASRMYDNEDQRSAWLKPILDFENNWEISKFFEIMTEEKQLHHLVKELWIKYPVNMDMLKDTINSSNEIMKIVDKDGKGLELMLKNYIDKFKTK